MEKSTRIGEYEVVETRIKTATESKTLQWLRGKWFYPTMVGALIVLGFYVLYDFFHIDGIGYLIELFLH
ncbi:MAG: hypothetical protein HGA67_01505 [Candidatus Yonathbacteria bacterium]|nr:hypothetical protein [Candidatus Yonathbacteria bacterium]